MPILVCPLSQVPHVVKARAPGRLVSLLDPGSAFPPQTLVARSLRIETHDIAFESVEGWTSPGAHHVRDVLGFVEDWDRADPILVHCYAGISRSTATAYTIACALNPQTDEGEIAQALRTASPSASPNLRLIDLADAELGRGGRMRRAIDAIGRGWTWEMHGEADPFELASRYGEGA